MRKFNAKFFLVLLGSFALLAGGLFGLHRSQQDRIAKALLRQAEHCRQENQPEKAAEYYFRYLEFKPDDTATRIAYGELLEEQLEKLPLGTRNPKAVIDLYEEALRKEPAHDDTRRKLVGLYMLPRVRKFEDALVHLEQLIDHQPEDGSLWQQRAVCEEGMARYDAAVKAFEKAVVFPPDQIRSHELFARLLRKRLNRNQQADDTIQQMVDKHGHDHEAWLAHARYRMDYNLGEVASDADKALALAPNNAEAILLASLARQTGGHVPEAVELLERGLVLYPTDARMYKHLAWIEYNLKKPEQARKRLEDGIVACPDSFDLHTALAEILIQGKMFDQVQKIIDGLKTKGVREDRIQYLTARIALEREQWTDAALILEKMRPDSRGNADLSIQLNLLLAQCYKQLGDGDRQQQSLTRVLEFDANNVMARQAMGALHATAGRLDEAVREYEHLIRLSNAPETAVTDLIRLMVALTERKPAGQQNWREVEAFFEQIARGQPNSVELILARSDLLSAEKRTKEAAAMLAKACEKSKDLRLWLQTAHYAEQADGSGLAVLNTAVIALGDRVEIRLKRAAILLGRSQADVVRSLPELEKPAPSFTPDQVAQLRAGLAELYLIVHDYSNAKRLYRQLANDRPSDLQARQMLAEIALREKDIDGLPKVLADVAKIEPPGGITHALLDARFQILLLVEKGDRTAAEKAREILQGLIAKRPTWPQILQAMGQLADAEEDRSKAIELYRQAIELGDLDLRTHQRLVALLVETKQNKAAEEVLQQVRKLGHLSMEQQRRMLQSVSPLLNSRIIQDYATTTVPRESMDPSDHVWLGKMYWDTGDRTKAIAEFRAALAQAGGVPDNWINLVQALVASRQLDEAKKAIAEARTKLPPETVAATVAVCLEITHQFDDSALEYESALKAKPDDPQLVRRYVRLLLNIGKNHEAAQFLQSVLAKPGDLTKEDIGWVRRNLAIIGTADRTPTQFARAFELLKQNETELGESIDELRAKVVILAHMPPSGDGTPPRRTAIAVIEKVLKDPRSNLDDRFSLAKLYDAERMWDKAETEYRAVIAADPKNPGPLSYYTRRLLQLDQTNHAAEPLARLEKLIPDSALAVTLRGRYLFQRGEIDALLFQMNGFLGRAKSDSDRFERMFVAGTLFDEFARSTLQPANQPGSAKRLCDAAISLYRDCVQAKPDALVRAAALNGHFGNLKGALAMLDQPGIPKNLKASATIEALRAAHADPAQCASTERWLMAEARNSRTHDLVMHLADLEEMKHNFADAEQLYREVLQTQKNNVVAMNNLAWVMAHYRPNTEALELVQRAITIAGPLADLLDTRAKVYLSLGRSAEAIQDLEDAINEAPTAKRYFQLALAEEQNKNPSAAKTAFGLARRYGIDARDLHPDDARMFERMAKAS